MYSFIRMPIVLHWRSCKYLPVMIKIRMEMTYSSRTVKRQKAAVGLVQRPEHPSERRQ